MLAINIVLHTNILLYHTIITIDLLLCRFNIINPIFINEILIIFNIVYIKKKVK